MIKAIAIDDEPPALRILQNYCKQAEELELLASFSQPSLGLKFLAENQIDLVFLDIQMPGTSGLQIAQKIATDTAIIFTTAYEEHALEGYNLNALDYLLKPFSYDRFTQAIHKAKRFISGATQTPKSNYLTVRSDHTLLRIPVDEICYLEAMDDHVKFFLDSSLKPLIVRTTIKSIVEVLPKAFLRIHRSFVVNVEKVSGARRGFVIINDKSIPIGLKYNDGIAAFIKGMRS